MAYEAKLDKIPLSVFIEIYTNPNNDIEFVGDKREAIVSLIEEYMDIVGGLSLASYLSTENTMLNESTMLEVVSACENLMLLGRYKEVSEILSGYGYNISHEDKEKMKSRLETLKSKSRYYYDKALQNREERKASNKTTTKEDFIKERVFLMRYNRLHIDVDRFSAAEYAYLVKQTTAEIEDIKRHKQKK